MILASKHEIPRTDEEPQTNAQNAYVCATRYIYQRYELRAGNHPGAFAPPLLIQEGSSARLPSSDEEGRRASGGGGAEQEMYKGRPGVVGSAPYFPRQKKS
jgi:hypothetical protein